MRDRPVGITAVAFGAVMVGLYCQYAAIGLILTGSVFTPQGSMPAAVTLLIGATFMGITVAAYAAGFGLWTRRRWAIPAGRVVFASFITANVVLSVLAANYVSTLLPLAGGVLALWYLRRRPVRAELGDGAPVPEPPIAVGDYAELVRPVH